MLQPDFRHRTAVALAAALLSIPMAFAQSGGLAASREAVQRGTAPAGPLSPQARGELSRQFVLKWGHYVERVYKVPAGTWARRMVPNFVRADATNLRRAAARDTFEGALAELNGTGHALPDRQAIDRLARASMARSTAKSKSGDLPMLGALGNDLVYTPLQPCRIVDTRSSAPGPIAANSTRSFVGINAANFTGQGGSATNCGTLGLNATALALNITAVTPGGAGYATVFPHGTTQPLASSVNYTAGAIVNNAIIAQIPNPLSSYDFTVYTFAQSHYVIDVVGYFSPPEATALDCTQTFTTTSVAANAAFDQAIPSCPAGYTLTGAGCRTPGLDDADWAISGLYQVGPGVLGAYCSGRNKTANSITVEGVGRCCRVPGR